jgi:hypothetical protein
MNSKARKFKTELTQLKYIIEERLERKDKSVKRLCDLLAYSLRNVLPIWPYAVLEGDLKKCYHATFFIPPK